MNRPPLWREEVRAQNGGQVSWLSDHCAMPVPSPPLPEGGVAGGSPMTVARPRRIFTGFPGAQPLRSALSNDAAGRPARVMGLQRLRAETRDAMQYYEPNFLDEALVLLERFGLDARILAGGTRVGPWLRRGADDIAALVNVKRIDELGAIEASLTTLRIGAVVTAAELRSHPAVCKHAPALAAAAASMGAPQLQTMATIGGNVCSGEPASDLSVALLACEAQCEVARSNEGTTSVPIERLLHKTAPLLRPGELLTAVEIPIHPQLAAYQKMTTRRGFEMSLVAVALCCRMDGDVVREARIGLAGAAATPIRASAAEAVLVGERLTQRAGRDAGRVAAEADAQPVSDSRAGDAYRRQLVATLMERAVLAAARSSSSRGN